MNPQEDAEEVVLTPWWLLPLPVTAFLLSPDVRTAAVLLIASAASVTSLIRPTVAKCEYCPPNLRGITVKRRLTRATDLAVVATIGGSIFQFGA